MTEFLIVGRGLAATCLMHVLHKRNISFRVIGDPSLSHCSQVAAGIWNPIVFKRFTKSWMADKLVPNLLSFYDDCEKTLGVKLVTRRSILKPFMEEQEKKLWKRKAEQELEGFLDPQIYGSGDSFPSFNIQGEYGLVKNAGSLDVALFLEASSRYFEDRIQNGRFDHQELRVSEQEICYQNVKARHIVFCEGYLVKDNPYFSWIPLKPAKGEILTIGSDLEELGTVIYNKDGFLMRIAENRYKIGATYEWQDLSEESTEQGKNELEEKLAVMTNKDYQVLEHQAGVRPSSLDRRPVIGGHPEHKNLFIFNGLGTKGVMLAPFFSENFVNFYLQQEPLHPEVDVKRFYKLYGQKT